LTVQFFRRDGFNAMLPAELSTDLNFEILAYPLLPAVQTELVRALGFPDRGLQERSDFTGFNWADVPVILVEMGFMTNSIEDRLLAKPSYQRRAAVGLCRGALRYLERTTTACR
jgi:N-acetylmuramoyl-L-alanine amidase